MTQNNLSYTNLDIDAMDADLKGRMQIDGTLPNFPEGSLAKTQIHDTMAIVDIANHNMEMLAREFLLPSAKNMTSVVAKANAMGYSIRRKTPAQAFVNISLQIPVSVNDGDFIHIPRFTKFTVNGLPFITTEPMTRNLKSSDSNTTITFGNFYRTTGNLGNQLLTDSEVQSLTLGGTSVSMMPIQIIQGEVREASMSALDSRQRGTLKLQRYKIPDVDFSDIYGQHDLYVDNVTGFVDRALCLTQVSVTNKADKLFSPETLYTIDRYSFVTDGGIYQGSYKSIYENPQGKPQICVMRTDSSGGIEIVFGDPALFSTPSDQNGSIVGIRYLRTKGAEANNASMKGSVTKATSEILLYKKNGSSYNVATSITFTSNIINGQGLEDIESIRENLPSYYSTIERLVTRDDYVKFFKSLTVPFTPKQAVVFGEQEYADYNKLGYKYSNPLRNTVVFSLLGELYDTSSAVYGPRQLVMSASSFNTTTDPQKLLNNQLLDGLDWDIWSMVAYYHLLARKDILTYRNRFEVSRYLNNDLSGDSFVPTEIGLEFVTVSDRDYPTSHPVKRMYEVLGSRSMLQVNHVYIPPVFQKFSLEGDVVISDYADIVAVKARIENAVFAYLQSNVGFQEQIQKSNIDEIINSDKDVQYSNTYFRAISDWSQPYTGTAFSAIETQLDCSTYIQNANTHSINILAPTDPCLQSSNGISYGALFYQFQGMIDQTNYAGLNATGSMVFILKADQYGKLTDNLTVDATWTKTQSRLLGSLVKLELNQNSIPFSIKNSNESAKTPVIYGSIDTANPVKIIVGSNPTISFPTSTTFDYSISNLQAMSAIDKHITLPANMVDGMEIIDNTLWVVTVSFPDSELAKIDMMGDTVYMSSNVSKEAKVVTSSWIDVNGEYDGNICNYSMGYCPEKYIADGIKRALKSIYAELNGVMVCSVCNTPTNTGVVTLEDNSVVKVCEGCKCSYEAHFSDSNYLTASQDFQNKSDQIWKILAKDTVVAGAKTYGSVYDQEAVFRGQTEPQKSYDLAEYFNVVVPSSLLSCWDKEFSLEKKIHHRIGVSERWFYEVLVKRIVNELRFDAFFNSMDTLNPMNQIQIDIVTKAIGLFLSNSNEMDLASSLDGTGLGGTELTSAFQTLGQSFFNSFKDIYTQRATVQDTNMVPNVENFLNSNAFMNIIYKLHQGFSEGIRSAMMDTYGNIVNYSLPNEIAQISSNLKFKRR